MKLQLAINRMKIEVAISLKQVIQDSIDWIEVDTSIIREFGRTSIEEVIRAFPKKIVGHIKTIDGAFYEFDKCYNAGADVATVMGVSLIVTIQSCLSVAKEWNMHRK